MESEINVPGRMKVRKTKLKLAFDALVAVREYLTIAVLHESVRVGTVETARQSSRGRVAGLVGALVQVRRRRHSLAAACRLEQSSPLERG